MSIAFIDCGKKLRLMHDADPILSAMLNGTGPSWGDLALIDEPEETEAQKQLFRMRQMQAEQQRIEEKQRLADELKLLEQKWQEEAELDAKYITALWASEDYWINNHCTCTEMDVETYVNVDNKPCKCFQKIHLNEAGEPEECRFFNSPAGCRDGTNCIYQHVTRDPSEIQCRFELSDVGCNPGFGRKCPYNHTKPQVPVSQVLCRFNFKCKPRQGTKCPYKHGF